MNEKQLSGFLDQTKNSLELVQAHTINAYFILTN